MPSGVPVDSAEVRQEENPRPTTELRKQKAEEGDSPASAAAAEATADRSVAATKPKVTPSAAVELKEEKKDDDDGVVVAEKKEEETNNSNTVEEQGVEVVLEEKGTSKVVVKEESTSQRQDSKSKAPAGTSRPTPDQNVFRHPQAVRPRASHGGQQPPHHQQQPLPYLHGSGSWGYGPPPPHGYGHPPPPPHHQHYPHHPHEYAPRPPYPVVPPYGSSASFDTEGSYHRQHGGAPHYSPHVHYPHPSSSSGRGAYGEDVNVISPHHKSGSGGDPHGTGYRPNLTPRPRNMQGHSPPHQASGSTSSTPTRAAYYQYPPASPVSRPGGPTPSGPPRVRDYAMRRSEGPYTKAQRGQPGAPANGNSNQQHPEDGTWNTYGPPGPSPSSGSDRRQPPLVTESSFDSEHRSHPGTPSNKSKAPGASSDSTMPPPAPASGTDHFYGAAPSWGGSFDSAPYGDHRYYNHPPTSPYGTYMGPYSPGGMYHADSFPPPYGGPSGSFSYSYDDEERLLRDYHPDRDGEEGMKQVTPPGKSKGRSKRSSDNSSNAMLLPKAAEEIDFDVADPPLEPQTQPSEKPVCESLADVNTYDVLCGRGGGTNSQVGNRRFRKLVQDFQPTYLLARRKEKPLLARTIVLIIRKRGGRFLKKDEDTGELYEVGDPKAEAKTSQALREGLDVRATKSAASSLLEKRKKKNKSKSDKDLDDDEEDEDADHQSSKTRKADKSPYRHHPGSPPTLPRLQGEEVVRSRGGGSSSSDQYQRKRRRTRGGGFTADRFFPDFCPPRADLARPASPMLGPPDHHPHHYGHHHHSQPPPPPQSSQHHAPSSDANDDNLRYTDSDDHIVAQGCTGIAMDMVTGAATGSFCLGPVGWRR